MREPLRAAAYLGFPVLLLVYIPALGGGFIWDDRLFLADNPHLASASGLVTIWTEPKAFPFPWYPLTLTSFWLEYQLWGLWPTGYHMVNVLLHAANAIVIGVLLGRLEVPGAWLAAFVFAVHPVHVESVAWIAERKNVLSGLFFLLAIQRYCGFAGLVAATNERVSANRWTSHVLSLLFFTAALLAKTATCMLPVVLVILHWWKQGRLGRREALSLLPFFAIGGLLGILTFFLETGQIGAEGTDWSLTWTQRILLAGRVLWFYAGKVVWPVGLVFVYPQWSLDSSDWSQYLYIAAAGGALIAIWSARRAVGRGPLAACLFFCVMLFPVLGFLDFYFMIYSFVADHYQYLASIGPIVLVSAVLWGSLPRWVGLRAVLTACALVTLALLSWQQAQDYTDEETLWRVTAERNPRAWMAQTNLGWQLAERGELDAAVEHLLAAVGENPRAVIAHLNLGIVRVRQGRLDDAIAQYREALRVDPESARAHNLIGVTLAWQGRTEEALGHFQTALRLTPQDPLVRANLERTLQGAWPKEPEPGAAPQA